MRYASFQIYLKFEDNTSTSSYAQLKEVYNQLKRKEKIDSILEEK